MAGRKLAPVSLKKLPAGKHGDGDGLYLNVEPSGSRSWILRTMVAGKRCEIGLGSLSTTSLAEARDEAARLRSRARKGENVIEERRLKKLQTTIPTFETMAVEYHAALKETLKDKDHAYNWLEVLRKYVFPEFGSKRIDHVDSADVLRAIGPIWNSIPETAKRALRRVKKILDYGAANGHRSIYPNGIKMDLPNPCDQIRAVLPKQNGAEKHHEGLPFPLLPDFIKKLRTLSAALSVKLAFEFMILTASRTSETMEAVWTEIDLDKRMWTIPAARMKMKKDHQVPLSNRAIEILRLAKEFNDASIVFPGRNAGRPLSNTAFLMALRRMGHGDLTGHGFRSTFKTWAQETTQFDHLVIEASMAHTVRGIERSYLRTSFLEQRRKLMDQWERFATATPSSKVVSLAGRT